MYHFVYKTVNLLNNKFYIGVHTTDNLYDSYLGSGKILQLAIKKYGKNNFERRILKLFSSREECLQFEKEILSEDMLTSINCYNICTGGGDPPSRKGKINPNTLLIKENRTIKQKLSSKDHSKRMKGKPPWNKGTKGISTGWPKGKKRNNAYNY